MTIFHVPCLEKNKYFLAVGRPFLESVIDFETLEQMIGLKPHQVEVPQQSKVEHVVSTSCRHKLSHIVTLSQQLE